LSKLRQHPIIILLTINLLIGLLTFQDYGISWDEPLFYDYADSLGYAYSPMEWMSGDFDLDKVYGASGSDHANRGPAYLFLARGPVYLLEFFGLDKFDAWHLVNFLTFQLGVYLFYRLARRWLSGFAALAATAFFAWQPLLWGHAFINPKDIPFLVFFLGAVYCGLELVDETADKKKILWRRILWASFFLGIATSIRVLGPLAGLLVGIYVLSRIRRASSATWIKSLLAYSACAWLITWATWPYLWMNPLFRFLDAFGFMSDNPTHLQVLFYGNSYAADDLPYRYLPVFLVLTLTEPVWLLFLAGLAAGFPRFREEGYFIPALLSLWFFIPFLYVLVLRPPMYDGFRHFLFILPPVFLVAGFAFERAFTLIRFPWLKAVLLLVTLGPSFMGMIQLHPYLYTYYNSFTGGTVGAFRRFETDYWLTCYKEAIEEFQSRGLGPANLYVNREGYIAKIYAGDELNVLERRGSWGNIQPGDYVLINTRNNEDRSEFRDAPLVYEIGRAGAVFCVVKQIP